VPTILRGPSDVVCKNQIHQGKEDVLRWRSAAIHPQPNRVFLYAERNGKLVGRTFDLDGTREKSGL
jgi:hypothetical protein